MGQSILQGYLDSGLFNIGEEDSRLQLFQQAANDLAAEFVKAPDTVISAVLVAVDPYVHETEPVLERVETAIRTHWNTFSNKYKERPVGLLRPVLLEALTQAADKERSIASALWLSGMNLASRINLGKERELIERLLLLFGEASEETVDVTFATEDKIAFKAPSLELKLARAAGTKVDVDSLETELAAAVGSDHPDGRQLSEPNPTSPANNPHRWANHCARRGAKGIAKEVDKAIAPLAKVATTIGDQLETPLSNFGKDLASAAGKWVSSAVRLTSQKTELLWWKETLYSPSLRCSYREMKPVELVVSMSQDLFQCISSPAPQSVEYFLREAVREALPDNPEISLCDFRKGVAESTRLNSILPACKNGEIRRLTLLEGLTLPAPALSQENAYVMWFGLPASFKVTAEALAVWLFRDSQALFLVANEVDE